MLGKSDKIEIVLKDWYYKCGDGCCDLYGTNIYINGEKMEDEDGSSSHQLLTAILTKLGYTDVVVQYDTEE